MLLSIKIIPSGKIFTPLKKRKGGEEINYLHKTAYILDEY